jgi:DNA-binding IscR family transcriptional regulator
MAGGYRLHEAAIRIALAYVYMAIGDRETAHTEASYAQQLSNQTGYYRGQTEAASLLADL